MKHLPPNPAKKPPVRKRKAQERCPLCGGVLPEYLCVTCGGIGCIDCGYVNIRPCRCGVKLG